jgi:quercetin dioxygenase-like cupin family protein
MNNEQPEMRGDNQAFHRPGTAEVVYWGFGDGVAILASGKDTNGAYAQVEGALAPGGEAPAHIHHHEDETFYVLEGSIELRVGEATYLARPGDYLQVPRGTVHALRNVGEHTARALVTFVPAGLEGFFAEVYQPVVGRTAPPPPPPVDLIDRMRQAAPRYGCEFVELRPPTAAQSDPEPSRDTPTSAPGMQH